ncbi:e3 ubiquitin-protein ligase RFWD3 [Nephila pilipes]|uniref:RING-type E3 ubiquitin transferase n=1 Tax=Nephila pilipes TaxID=299642 RepID=A0A8X6NAB6_NEPPI|nr:e3 ubiquitin-protein ligase RFWD3 [Nephila pilipes]
MERQMQEEGSSSDEDELAVLIVDSDDEDSDALDRIVHVIVDRNEPMDATGLESISPVQNIQSSSESASHHSVVHLTPDHPQPIGGGLRRSTPRKDLESKASAEVHENQSVDDDGQTCTICFEPWTNSSEHRLVSLRCGHLFGRSCITRWLKGQSARCPQCNARARKSEIRNIYAKAVKVMDSTERDKALLELQKERELRRKAEMTVNEEKLKYMMSAQECERLKKELIEANKLLQEYRCGIKIEKSQSVKGKIPVFSLEKSLEIAKNGGCRIVDVCDILGMALVSQQSINDLFPGHGFRKISTFDMKPSEFVLVHQKPIRDMAFHCHDGLVLTASLDKSVKITNVLTNSVVHSYSHDSDVWSCTWDLDNPVYFYAGLKSGDVYLYDIRVTSRYVHELPRFGCKTPVVALKYLKKTSCSSYSKCGPVVGKLSDCAFYQKQNQQDDDYKIVPLPTIGPYTSLSSEPISGHFLVSSRPSPKQPCVTHTVCELVSDQIGQDLICNPVQTLLGGRTQLQLSRSILLPHPVDTGSLLVCAGDEDAHGAVIWNGSSGKVLDTFRTESSVLDLAESKINHKTYLFGLTDKTLRLFSWIGQ